MIRVHSQAALAVFIDLAGTQVNPADHDWLVVWTPLKNISQLG